MSIASPGRDVSADPSRRRKKPETARADALEAGRRLLVEGGPRAVTLKAIGAALGTSHANLIHHFGSAEQFQARLADAMLQQLTRTITDLVERHGRGDADLQTIVTTLFGAYGPGGIGALIAWSALNGETRAAEGLEREVGALVLMIEPLIRGPDAPGRAREMVRLLTSLAFADSLLGRSMAAVLGEAPGEAQARAVRLLRKMAAEQIDDSSAARTV